MLKSVPGDHQYCQDDGVNGKGGCEGESSVLFDGVVDEKRWKWRSRGRMEGGRDDQEEDRDEGGDGELYVG